MEIRNIVAVMVSAVLFVAALWFDPSIQAKFHRGGSRPGKKVEADRRWWGTSDEDEEEKLSQ